MFELIIIHSTSVVSRIYRVKHMLLVVFHPDLWIDGH